MRDTLAMTAAQIDAGLALDGLGQRRVPPEELAEIRRDARPLVERQCICPNQHKPDAQGFIITSPSCSFHGLEARIKAMPVPMGEERPLSEVHMHTERPCSNMR